MADEVLAGPACPRRRRLMEEAKSNVEGGGLTPSPWAVSFCLLVIGRFKHA